jgi:ATP-dependent DNA helicase RecQ
VEVTPRKMWPSGMAELGIDVTGKIPAGVSAEPGRALGRPTDLGWGPRLRALLADDAPDGPVPGDVIEAVVKVLAAWDWAQRPAGVITLASRSRPQLIESLGTQLAEIGRMPYLGRLEYAAGPGSARPRAQQHNSAQRLRALWHELVVPGSVAAAAAALTSPVLLVDDRIDTGWTMTVAARLLREAGAAGVLPLALAVSTG